MHQFIGSLYTVMQSRQSGNTTYISAVTAVFSSYDKLRDGHIHATFIPILLAVIASVHTFL